MPTKRIPHPEGSVSQILSKGNDAVGKAVSVNGKPGTVEKAWHTNGGWRVLVAYDDGSRAHLNGRHVLLAK